MRMSPQVFTLKNDESPKLSYWSDQPDIFSFELLQRTEGSKVVCKDATAEKVDSITPLALEKAFQSSARISHPDTSEYLWSPAHGRRLVRLDGYND
ncbi:hypothetical protein PABG_12466 [Paracoccidioides brasiliensis Pb03]|nr:hypothetical protein PABG_12466 [Paracoccidioides brasiliensis Pb03]